MRPFEGTHRNSMTRLKRHVSGDAVQMYAGWQPAHPRSWLVPAHSWGGGAPALACVSRDRAVVRCLADLTLVSSFLAVNVAEHRWQLQPRVPSFLALSEVGHLVSGDHHSESATIGPAAPGLVTASKDLFLNPCLQGNTWRYVHFLHRNGTMVNVNSGGSRVPHRIKHCKLRPAESLRIVKLSSFFV